MGMHSNQVRMGGQLVPYPLQVTLRWSGPWEAVLASLATPPCLAAEKKTQFRGGSLFSEFLIINLEQQL